MEVVLKHNKIDFNYFKIIPKHVFSEEGSELFENLDCCEWDFLFEVQGTYWRMRFSFQIN